MAARRSWYCLVTILLVSGTAFGLVPGLVVAPASAQVRGDLSRLSMEQKRELRRTATVRAIQRGGKAVVAINTTKSAPQNPFYNNPNPFGGGEGNATSLGSGVIVNQQGYTVTNEHVVSQATDITVKLADGRVFKAQV
ncbi:MAG: hypothetical protein RBU30_25455, partial [Polyangia bacterium]|nr:hypothetical protein [Polyangia bacterium]